MISLGEQCLERDGTLSADAGGFITDKFDDTTPDRAAKTIAAMKDGIDIIYQGALEHDGWFGYADVLRRIDTPSPHLGEWSYEVIDTKLSRETKATTILQIATKCP